MSTKTELIDGLKAVRRELVEKINDPSSDRSILVGAGFVVGWIDAQGLPMCMGIPSSMEAMLDAETDQFLAALRDDQRAQ